MRSLCVQHGAKKDQRLRRDTGRSMHAPRALLPYLTPSPAAQSVSRARKPEHPHRRSRALAHSMLTARAPAAIAMATPIAQQVILPTVTRLAPLAARLATRGLHQAPRAIASTQPVTTSAAGGKGVRGMRTAAACWPSAPMPDASRTRAAFGANIQRHLHGSHRHSSGGGGFAGGGPFKGQSFEEFMGFPMPRQSTCSRPAASPSPSTARATPSS